MGAEPSGDAVEVAVVVAGMAAEFEDALGGHGVKDLGEGFAVEAAGGGDADGSHFNHQPQIREAHVLTTDGTIGISAGGRDADGSVGGEDMRFADLGLVFEMGFETAEEFDLKTAN